MLDRFQLKISNSLLIDDDPEIRDRARLIAKSNITSHPDWEVVMLESAEALSTIFTQNVDPHYDTKLKDANCGKAEPYTWLYNLQELAAKALDGMKMTDAEAAGELEPEDVGSKIEDQWYDNL